MSRDEMVHGPSQTATKSGGHILANLGLAWLTYHLLIYGVLFPLIEVIVNNVSDHYHIPH